MFVRAVNGILQALSIYLSIFICFILGNENVNKCGKEFLEKSTLFFYLVFSFESVFKQFHLIANLVVRT